MLKKSHIPHILVAAIIIIAGGAWACLVFSIDYTQLNAKGKYANPPAAQQEQAPEKTPAPSAEPGAEPGTAQ